jgi:glycolate oxidase FAD binding subunit
MSGPAVPSLSGLRAALGADVVEWHGPLPVEGCTIRATLRPRDGAELSRALAALSEHAEPVLLRGRGTRLSLGNAPRPAQVMLATERIAGIEELDRVDGVVRVRAGTPIADVAAAADEAGWELPLDPPGETSTVGGALATAASGPHRQRFGAPRDCVLGLDVVLPTGERTRCGARVVKNVTGYDMAKLYTGSFGTLGVIEAAWLRLRPAPAERATFLAALPGADSEEPFRAGLAAARRSSARAVALVFGDAAARLGAPSGRDAGGMLVVELGGDAPAVERDAAWLREDAGARDVAREARLVGRLRELQGGLQGDVQGGLQGDLQGGLTRDGAVRARLAVLPSRLSQACAPLAAAGLSLIAYPGPGIVYALANAVTLEGELAAALAVIDRTAAAVGADLLYEALPLTARRTRDVFGHPGSTHAIARALKDRFDPAGVLNPGRFQGRL